MKRDGYWYQLNDTSAIDTPALLVYPDRVIHNIELLKSMVTTPGALRPHVKTNKSVDVGRLMVSHGISKFKCATIAEAEMLGRCGAEDVLLAYQPTDTKLMRFVKLMGLFPNTIFSCLVDNAVTAKHISDAAMANGLVIPVYIDLNVGMDRTGIDTDKALPLFEYLTTLPGIAFKGLHAYDGHIEEEDIAERTAHCEAEFAHVEQLRQNIERSGHPYPLLIAGGSPTLGIHAKRPHTECSPGTFIFWDKNYHDHVPDLDFAFAALVLTRVVSLPDATKICVDMGYKSIACEKPLQTRAHFLNAHLKAYSHSEEHMVLEAGEGPPYQVGDEFYVVPMHICPTVAMYDHAYVIENGACTGKWEITARSRELTV